MKFSYRGSYRGSVPADVAAHELRRIHEAHGVLSPQTIVDESMPEGAPLHPEFDWDDSHAANEHRKWQARNLVRAVQVTVEPGAPIRPIYVNVPAADSQELGVQSGYQPVAVVVRDEAMFATVLREALLRVQAAQETLHELERAATTQKQRTASRKAVEHVQAARVEMTTVTGATQ